MQEREAEFVVNHLLKLDPRPRLERRSQLGWRRAARGSGGCPCRRIRR